MSGNNVGDTIPGTNGLTHLETLHEGPWGRVVRAGRPDDEGTALVVCYTGAEGALLFAEAKAGLELWKRIREENNCPQLLDIEDIREEADEGVVIVGDPGVKPLVHPPAGGDSRLEAAVVFWEWGNRALLDARNCDFNHLGLSPITVFESPDPGDGSPYRILPLAPGARGAALAIAGGRYTPPEISSPTPHDELDADSFALAVLTVESLAGGTDVGLDPDSIRQAIPFPRLRTILSNSLSPSGGTYADPNLTAIALRRWLKHERDADLKEVRAKTEALGRSPLQQKLHDNRRILLQAAGGVVGLVLIVALLMAIPAMITPTPTRSTPYGLLSLFHEALLEGDAAAATELTAGEASGQVAPLLALIDQMQEQNLASPFARAIPQVSGDGPVRTAKADLRGTAGDAFIETEMTLRQDDNGQWAISALFFRPLREAGE